MRVLDTSYFRYSVIDHKWHPYKFEYDIFVPDGSDPSAERKFMMSRVEAEIRPRDVIYGTMLREELKSYDPAPDDSAVSWGYIGYVFGFISDLQRIRHRFSSADQEFIKKFTEYKPSEFRLFKYAKSDYKWHPWVCVFPIDPFSSFPRIAITDVDLHPSVYDLPVDPSLTEVDTSVFWGVQSEQLLNETDKSYETFPREDMTDEERLTFDVLDMSLDYDHPGPRYFLNTTNKKTERMLYGDKLTKNVYKDIPEYTGDEEEEDIGEYVPPPKYSNCGEPYMSAARHFSRIMLKVIEKRLNSRDNPELLKDEHLECDVPDVSPVDQIMWDAQWNVYKNDPEGIVCESLHLLNMGCYVPNGWYPVARDWTELLITKDKSSDDALREVALHLATFLKETEELVKYKTPQDSPSIQE